MSFIFIISYHQLNIFRKNEVFNPENRFKKENSIENVINTWVIDID